MGSLLSHYKFTVCIYTDEQELSFNFLFDMIGTYQLGDKAVEEEASWRSKRRGIDGFNAAFRSFFRMRGNCKQASFPAYPPSQLKAQLDH